MRATLLLSLVLLVAPGDLAAQTDCPEQRARLDGIESVLARRPDDATLHFYKSLFLARCGRADLVAEALAAVARHGEGFLPVADFGFDSIWSEPRFRVARARLEASLPIVTDAYAAYASARADLVPEGIAYDAVTDKVYMGSMAQREIVELTRVGTETRLLGPTDGLGQILGLVVDSARRQLIAVDIGPQVPEGEPEPTGAVIVIDLEARKIVRRLEAAGAAQLNDVTVAADGTIYATDSGTGKLRRAKPASVVLEPWWPDLALPGANGLALSADGRALYVAHSTGIGRIEIASGELLPRIDNDTRETLGAIDGLYLRDNALYGVQNVTNPGRVIAATLDDTGTTVTAVRTLLSHHHPTLSEPTTGALAGNQFLLLANSHVARLQPDGTIRDEETLTAPVVLAIEIK